MTLCIYCGKEILPVEHYGWIHKGGGVYCNGGVFNGKDFGTWAKPEEVGVGVK